jgi:hypothetical protein
VALDCFQPFNGACKDGELVAFMIRTKLTRTLRMSTPLFKCYMTHDFGIFIHTLA